MRSCFFSFSRAYSPWQRCKLNEPIRVFPRQVQLVPGIDGIVTGTGPGPQETA